MTLTKGGNTSLLLLCRPMLNVTEITSTYSGIASGRKNAITLSLSHSPKISCTIRWLDDGKSIGPSDFFRRRIFEVRFSARSSALRPAFEKLINNKKGGHVVGAGGSTGIGHWSSSLKVVGLQFLQRTLWFGKKVQDYYRMK